MERIYPFFPLGETIKSKDVKSLVIALVIYILAAAAVSVAASLTGWIPIVGRIIRVIEWVFDLYCGVGMILAIVKFVRM